MKQIAIALIAAVLATVSEASQASKAVSYVGSQTCKTCHPKQYDSWKKTKMGRSFDLLRPGVAADAKKRAGLDPSTDFTKDQTCLPCHSTGFGKPGGYDPAAPRDELLGVGCEMCHGPAGEYVRIDRMSEKSRHFRTADLAKLGLIAKPTEGQCLLCHNKQSPSFKPFVFTTRRGRAAGMHAFVSLKYSH